MAYITPTSTILQPVINQINNAINQVWSVKRNVEKNYRKELIAYKLAKTVYLVEQKRLSPWSALQYGVSNVGLLTDSQKIDQLTTAINAATAINSQITEINRLTSGLTSGNADATISSINGIFNSINASASVISLAGSTIATGTVPTPGATGPTVSQQLSSSLTTTQGDISSVGANLAQVSADLQAAGISNAGINASFNSINTAIYSVNQVTNSINSAVKTFNKISGLLHLGASGPVQTKRMARNAPIQLPPELDPTKTIYFKLLVDLRNLLVSLQKSIDDLNKALSIIL